MRTLFASDKAIAFCRVEREARRGSHEGSSAGRARGGGGASSAQGRTQLRGLLGGARAARTLNMYCMFVTLEMSKLSGWLNADAFCAESKGNHGKRSSMWGLTR